MHVIAGLALAAVIAGCGAYGVHRVTAGVTARLPAPAREAARKAGGKARKAAEPLRNVIVKPMAEARAKDWLEHRRAKRDARALKPARERGQVVRRLVTPRGAPRVPDPRLPAAAPVVIPPPVAAPPPPQQNERRLTAVPDPQPSRGNGRTPPVTTGTNGNGAAAGLGAGADMLNSVHQLVTHVMAGGIQGKQRGFSVASESLSFMADQFVSMGRAMAEPGQNYPASAYEPWLVAASHLQAAAMACGEGGSVIQSIRSMTVGELAGSAMRAPHHDELNKA